MSSAEEKRLSRLVIELVTREPDLRARRVLETLESNRVTEGEARTLLKRLVEKGDLKYDSRLRLSVAS